ncbi:acyl-ACP desaturase [Kitasatospora sp. NPDC056181]|uniref:acyl-ACP desaturase n=1 Tax=Kitasatospora sp. NPDC056181 TaxID=3345737 RepID=UPI0035D69288
MKIDTAEAVRWLAELEPVAEDLMNRHLGAAREWFPHQYVPWSLGRDFDGPLGGEPWRPEQSALSPAVRSALVVNLLTEDNLPGYHWTIASRTSRDGAWGAWLHRWTAGPPRRTGTPPPSAPTCTPPAPSTRSRWSAPGWRRSAPAPSRSPSA